MEQLNGIQALNFKSRNLWRRWLEKNHTKEKSVWLILHNRDSKTPGMKMDEAVEEALCFGWIDSKAVKRDAESRYQYFSQRKPKSNWSSINRARVERLTAAGLMTPAGQALVDFARNNGTWEALVDVENAVIPEDLQKRFDKNKKALRNFQAFSPSARRIIIYWIHSAKRPETRKKRIEETVRLAAQNLKAYP